MSETQEVNFLYNFELRGDRQVERGFEGFIEKMLRANSAADVLGAGVEKLGRVFEVGLPIGLAAAGVGLLIDKFSEVMEKTDDLNRSMKEVSEFDLDNASIKDLDSDVEKAEKNLENATKTTHSWYDALVDVGGQLEHIAGFQLDKALGVQAGKNAANIDFENRQKDLEASGQTSQAKKEKITHDTDDKIKELESQKYTRTKWQLANGTILDNLNIFGGSIPYGAHKIHYNVAQDQIDALKRQRAGEIADVDKEDKTKADREATEKATKATEKATEQAAKLAALQERGRELQAETPEQKEAYFKDKANRLGQQAETATTPLDQQEKFNGALEAIQEAARIQKEIDADKKRVADEAKSKFDEKKSAAQRKVDEDAKRVTELTARNSEMAGESRFERVVTTHQHELGGGGRAYGGGKVNQHEKEIQRNTTEISNLNREIQALITVFGIKPQTTTL